MEKTVDPHPVGFRFRPTDEEIVDHYLRSKNMDGNTSHVDEVISTVDICSFDPWELASHSITTRKETDYVWYFYGRKDNRGERQSRKTKSGFWKKTGNTMDIFRKRGNHEQIGEKRVLVFHYSGKILGGPKPKSEWVMHEYVATFLSPTPTAMVTYTVCKVMFKGDTSDLPSTSACAGGCEVEHSHTLITPMNNLGGGLSSEAEESSSELQDPRQFSGFLHLEEETQIEDAIRRAINNLSPHDLNSLLNNDYDDDEQGKTQE